jgi:hypothetical protein
LAQIVDQNCAHRRRAAARWRLLQREAALPRTLAVGEANDAVGATAEGHHRRHADGRDGDSVVPGVRVVINLLAHRRAEGEVEVSARRELHLRP